MGGVERVGGRVGMEMGVCMLYIVVDYFWTKLC
jgi:hypothetical protein